MWEEIAYGQTDGQRLTNYYIDMLQFFSLTSGGLSSVSIEVQDQSES